MLCVLPFIIIIISTDKQNKKKQNLKSKQNKKDILTFFVFEACAFFFDCCVQKLHENGADANKILKRARLLSEAVEQLKSYHHNKTFKRVVESQFATWFSSLSLSLSLSLINAQFIFDLKKPK